MMESIYHVRSNSLPSIAHPATLSVKDHLYRLRASEETTSSVSLKLGGLKDLYDSIDDLLKLPFIQQSIYQDPRSENVEEALDGSLRLLDVCETTRYVLSQIREYMKDLELSLRRRRGGESGLENVVKTFMVSKMKLNKVIEKSLRNFMSEKKCTLANQVPAVKTLREAEEISLGVFKSLLSFMAQPKARSRFFVAKLFQSKRIACDEVDASEVENIDSELLLMMSAKTINPLQVQSVLKGLEACESNVREIEEKLDCIHRRLMKTRVSLLNIVNQ